MVSNPECSTPIRNLWESLDRIVGFLSNIPCFTPITRAVQDYAAFATRLGEIKGIYFQADSNGRRIHRAKRQISLGSASFEFITFNEQETTKINRVFSEKNLCNRSFKAAARHLYVSILLSTRLRGHSL